jgi:Fe-S cluster assembly protein SufB
MVNPLRGLQKRLGNVEAPKVAMDYVWDSASILTSFREELSKFGVVFCSISEAVKEYPDLVRQHLGSVVSVVKCCLKLG